MVHKFVIGVLAILGCGSLHQTRVVAEHESPKLKTPDLLYKHTDEFSKPEIIKVADNVYQAIGFGIANSMLIEGQDGVIIIDTMESVEAARDVKKVFDGITKKPVEGIIITHNHGDHLYGAGVFVEDPSGSNHSLLVDVYGHASLKTEAKKQRLLGKIVFMRALKQFGQLLHGKGHVNSGIGIKLRYEKSSNIAPILPNKVFSGKSMKIEVSGVKLELYHAPGETDDQIVVWYPEKKIVFAADNIYRAFPNIYAIRGTPNRNADQWAASLDLMKKLEPEILVPSHTRPVWGKQQIKDLLIAYRDGIQFIHDQTVRYINKGFHPEKIAELVKLPQHLVNHDFLQTFYGTVPWSVKGIFTGYMGWFSGKASELNPLSADTEASYMVELAGGPEQMLQKVRQALAEEKYQWALQLAETLLETNQHAEEAKDVAIRCLYRLAETQVSAPGRNWYLTTVLELQGANLRPGRKMQRQNILQRSVISLQELFKVMTVMVDPASCADVVATAVFHFEDVGETIGFQIRRGVAEVVTEVPADWEVDLHVRTTDTTWRQIVARMTHPLDAAASGKFHIEEGTPALSKFMSYFDIEDYESD